MKKSKYALFLLLWLSLSFVQAQDCPAEECLWPGDANRNGVCNNMDYLWLGLASGDIFGGAIRADATINWTPQNPPVDWTSSFPVSGINYKYADTSGDGWIDGADLELFPDLYGQFNDQFTDFLGHEIPGDDLFMEISNPNPSPGETVEISIHLGNEANVIEDISGLAFTLAWDTTVVNEEATTFTELGGWMGTIGPNFYATAKLDGPSGIVEPEFAFTRLEGSTVSGSGEIARMRIVIEDVIVGLDGEPLDSIRLDLDFRRVLGINAFEEDLLITSQPGTLLVTETETTVLPSPFHIQILRLGRNLHISGHEPINSLLVYDAAGHLIRRWANRFTVLEFPVSEWPAGIYFLQFQSDDCSQTKKLFIY